ncbi:MAG: hypothetical protein DMG95_11630 [Acidobacteria bacterium]|nr:MAG: hypothetical protein DMG95_11630 [Acidobacteriota bacterium]
MTNKLKILTGEDSGVSFYEVLCALCGQELSDLFFKIPRFLSCEKFQFMASSNIFLRKDARIGGFHN